MKEIDNLIQKYTKLCIECDFLQNLQAKTLTEDRFYKYIQQDSIFLLQYGECFTTAAQKTNNLRLKERLLRWGRDCIIDAIDMSLKFNFFDNLQNNNIKKTKECDEYLLFLKKILDMTTEEILFATLSCTILYARIFKNIQSKEFDYYSSQSYQDSASRFYQLCNEFYNENMIDIFEKGCKMELLFWNI